MKRMVVAVVALVLASVGGPDAATSLPERLTNAEFWRMTAELSEPEGPFFADNFVSNERSFAQTIPQITAQVAPGRVYLGVGPEQNFSFIAAARPGMAFVLDIRRDNYLLQLLYKALFSTSRDRVTFLSRLFGRECKLTSPETATAAALIAACAAATPLAAATDPLHPTTDPWLLLSFPPGALSDEDWTRLRRIHTMFRRLGPSITYGLTPSGEAIGPFGLGAQVTQVDATGAELSFLASEARYGLVRDLQQRNLIVPVVGNFAGAKALRAIGAYVRSHGALLGAFYVSNVEDYLGPVPSGYFNNGSWLDFCRNVATIPLDSSSAFLRPYGLTVYDERGALKVNREISISGSTDADATIYQPRSEVTLPASLFPVQPELKACAGK